MKKLKYIILTMLIVAFIGLVMVGTIDNINYYESLNSTTSLSDEEIKGKMIYYECIAFATTLNHEYVNIEQINQTELQIYLNGYKYYKNITISVGDIMTYLKSDLNENGASIKTYEKDENIADYVCWVNVCNDCGIYESKIIAIWNQYSEEKGIDDNYSFYSLTPDDINQLSEKLINPDYEITIELPEE